MERLTRARDAVVEAVLAGLAVALVEGIRVGSGLATTLAIAGAAAVTLVSAAIVVRAGLALLVRLPPFPAWTRGGRVAMAWSAALVATSIVAFAWGAFRVFAWAHENYRFHTADAIGAVVVVIDLALAAALVLFALLIDRRVRPRLPATLLDGRAGALAAGVGLVLLVAVPSLLVRRAVPEFELAPVPLAALLVACVIALMVVDVPRAGRWGALAGVLAALAGTWTLASLPEARLAIVERGVPSKLTAQLVWRLADSDRDGFPAPSVGGADCDDGNPARNPGATDVAGNTVDENCSGADAVAVPSAAVPAATVATKPNIILISVDALRADRLGSYGYARKTPVLDRLAADGVRFTYAYTSCPSTRCAIPSLHTGRFRPAAETPSLATQLRAAGYDTGAITCCERFANPEGELAGFRTVDASADAVRMQRAGQSNGDVVVNRVQAWLRTSAARPYFLWVHFYEPHSPYEAPAGPDLGDSDSDRYDREVAYLDTQIARLLEEDPTALVIVTADHGEELSEHGIRFHARSLYNQVIRVPLIIKGPGIAPRVLDTPVSIVDVVPTLLELAGAPTPAGLSGRSLAPALHGGAPPTRPILVELPHDHQIKRDMAAVIRPPYKAIWDREANAWSLFELDDVADANAIENPEALAQMQRLLYETLDRETSRAP